MPPRGSLEIADLLAAVRQLGHDLIGIAPFDYQAKFDQWDAIIPEATRLLLNVCI